MGYRVIYNFDDGSSEDVLDEVFETYEEAEEAAEIGASNYSQGNAYLEEAGESYCDSKIVDWDIEEVKRQRNSTKSDDGLQEGSCRPLL